MPALPPPPPAVIIQAPQPVQSNMGTVQFQQAARTSQGIMSGAVPFIPIVKNHRNAGRFPNQRQKRLAARRRNHRR
jgi:hypothetical protein